METASVTFETKCWEKDWRHLLETDRLQRAIEYNQYEFSERILYINNVSRENLTTVLRAADACVDRDILTSYLLVEDYAEAALAAAGLTKADLGIGYYYSIAELVGIYCCRTEYLLHFSSDSMLTGPCGWLEPAIDRLRQWPAVKVANPVWNSRYEEAKQEALLEDGDWYIGFGFSDQCYLIAPAVFRQTIYQETHPAAARYPAYGGELFEKRVDAWMRNHGCYRITYKHGAYVHQNF
ncbi:MAG: hypothetical protein E6X17_15595 [Sporomusaceae bacterium]|nr:hypothetical protein [Sporomusaceae bacterium]